jgi:hypothetical protein
MEQQRLSQAFSLTTLPFLCNNVNARLSFSFPFFSSHTISSPPHFACIDEIARCHQLTHPFSPLPLLSPLSFLCAFLWLGLRGFAKFHIRLVSYRSLITQNTHTTVLSTSYAPLLCPSVETIFFYCCCLTPHHHQQPKGERSKQL